MIGVAAGIRCAQADEPSRQESDHGAGGGDPDRPGRPELPEASRVAARVGEREADTQRQRQDASGETKPAGERGAASERER